MGIVIRVTSPGLGQQTFIPGQNGVTCPALEKLPTGDGPVRWTYTFRQYADALPAWHAHVSVEDDVGGGEIQTGRVSALDPPDTDTCEGGVCAVTAEGYNASLADRGFGTSVVYGAAFGTGATIALTPEAAVSHAVSQLGSSVTLTPPVATGFQIPDSENFLGRSATDVIASMANIGASLATPFVWSVKRGVFRWGPLDTGARYAVNLGPGVVYRPHGDAKRLYNSVIVVWDRDQAVSYPTIIPHDQLPGIVTLRVNASGEIGDFASATRLAESLFGRLQALELAWGGTLTMTDGRTHAGDERPNAPAITSAGAIVAPYALPAGNFILMNGLDATARYGRAIPHIQLVTHVTWDGERNILTCELGEMRGAAEFARIARHAVYDAVSRTSLAAADASLSVASRDADKTRLVGPALADDPSQTTDDGSPSPRRLDHGTPTVDVKQNTVDPASLPPVPPEIVVVLASLSTTGEKLTTWHPPTVFTRYSMRASASCTVTVTAHRVSDGVLMLTLGLAGEQQKLNRPITATESSFASGTNLPTLAARDGLCWSISVADSAMTEDDAYLSIGVENRRYYPNYVNTAPATGTAS